MPSNPPSSNAEDEATLLKAAQDAVGVVETEPQTHIQLRLPDGRRVTGAFNNAHTVAVVRSFLAALAHLLDILKIL